MIDSLQTPWNDATRIAALLKEKYGFTVRVLQDADGALLSVTKRPAASPVPCCGR